ncbi:MAG: site-2 protease family protein [Clostridia bacterium]|nr:site-2 protease family protein [Clostridia bacterium]
MLDFLIELLLVAPTVLIALTFHECAHGYIAYKLGDPTAKYLGRLSLNPIKHIDPLGAICMLIAHFGWAKPVPIDITNFKNPKRDVALSALAGPVANILLGFIGCLIYSVTINLLPAFYEKTFGYYIAYVWVNFIYYFGWLNISLAIFNLLPIPPLDGSKILYAFLPPKAYNGFKRHEREIALVFMLIIILDSRFLGGYVTGFLSYIVGLIHGGFVNLFNLLF